MTDRQSLDRIDEVVSDYWLAQEHPPEFDAIAAELGVANEDELIAAIESDAAWAISSEVTIEPRRYQPATKGIRMTARIALSIRKVCAASIAQQMGVSPSTAYDQLNQLAPTHRDPTPPPIQVHAIIRSDHRLSLRNRAANDARVTMTLMVFLALLAGLLIGWLGGRRERVLRGFKEGADQCQG